MPAEFSILVADRNRHVRDFLRRELGAEGYRIQVARECREVLSIIDGDQPPDLLILDLELPHGDCLTLLEAILIKKPSLAVIIHSFLTEYINHPVVQSAAAFVEKVENTDCLKAVVAQVLEKYYPNRSVKRRTVGLEGGCSD